jgi:hypothetical protein
VERPEGKKREGMEDVDPTHPRDHQLGKESLSEHRSPASWKREMMTDFDSFRWRLITVLLPLIVQFIQSYGFVTIGKMFSRRLKSHYADIIRNRNVYITYFLC